MIYTIYTVSHPITNDIVYVGCTKNLENRRINYVRGSNPKSLKISQFVQSLKDIGLIPVISEIDTVEKCDAFYIEMYWIQQFKAWGFPLLNTYKVLPSIFYTKRKKTSRTYMFKSWKMGSMIDIDPENVNSFKACLRAWNKLNNFSFTPIYNILPSGKVRIRRVKSVDPQIIYCYSKDGVLLKEYSLLKDVEADGFSRATVHACINGGIKTSGKCLWKVANKKIFGLEKGVKRVAKK